MSKKKNNKAKEAKATQQRDLSYPATFITDNIIFSKRACWAYYKISHISFDFLPSEMKDQVAEQVADAFARIASYFPTKVDCHYYSCVRPFDSDGFDEQMRENHKYWQKAPVEGGAEIFEKFIESQHSLLGEHQFEKRYFFLGIKLFDRKSLDLNIENFFEYGFEKAKENLRSSMAKMFSLTQNDVSTDELERARNLEKKINSAIGTGILAGVRVSSEEIMLVNKSILYPSMPTPGLTVDPIQRVGLSDILLENTGAVYPHMRKLEIHQEIEGEEFVGYRASFVLAKLPEEGYNYPYINPPFVYLISAMGLPFAINSRFTLKSREVMKKELSTKKREETDELNNLVDETQISEELRKNHGVLQDLEQKLEENTRPYFFGTFHVTIEVSQEEYLPELYYNLNEKMKTDGFVLKWTSGTQVDLMTSEFLGGEKKNPIFEIIADSSLLGVVGFNLYGEVGDPIKQKF